MLYNNPDPYQTDYLPAQIAELAEAHKNLVASEFGWTPSRGHGNRKRER